MRPRTIREKIGALMAVWLAIALEPAVVRRALAFAVIVGAVLIAINHGDAILRGELDAVRAAKMALTLMVPYLVSTISSVGAIRELRGVSTTKE